MDHHISYSRVGWAVSIFSVLAHLLSFAYRPLITDPSAGELIETLTRLGHPGYHQPNATGVVLVLVEAFICAWIGSVVFVWLYNHTKKCCTPEDLFCESEREQ